MPEPTLDLELAIKVGFDQLALASMIATRPGSFVRDVAALALEIARSARALRALGLAREAGVVSSRAAVARGAGAALAPQSLGFSFEHLSFESGYEPHLGEPGRERWLSYALNREAHAWVLRHARPGRPWLVCIHGYGMGIARGRPLARSRRAGCTTSSA